MTNQQIMDVMEEVAKDWAKGKHVWEVAAVASYMNELCAKWMGGNWGLKVEHLMEGGGDEQGE